MTRNNLYKSINSVGKYNERSYHQLRQMYRNLPAEDKLEVNGLICNYGWAMTARDVRIRHPDWPEAKQKWAVVERLYQNDFSVEEMARIKASFLESQHQK